MSASDWTSGDEIGDYRIRGREDEDTILLIMKDFVFTCQGNITQWRLQWHYRDGLSGCTIHFHFYVMRQLEDCGNVIITGENHFTETINQNGDSTILTVERVFSVLSEHQLQVQEEDFHRCGGTVRFTMLRHKIVGCGEKWYSKYCASQCVFILE